MLLRVVGVYLFGFLIWVHPWEVIELSYLVFANDTKLFHAFMMRIEKQSKLSGVYFSVLKLCWV